MLNRSIRAAVEKLGWRVAEYGDDFVSFMWESPAGYDTTITAHSDERLVSEVLSIYGDFDVDQFVFEHYQALKHKGCSKIVEGLLEDAKAIQKMYGDLAFTVAGREPL